MKRWLAFLDVCAFLREGLLGERQVDRPVESWESVIEVSNLQLVSPALAWCLKDRTHLPPDVRDYFSAVRELNCERESAILAALDAALQALNDVGIEPLLLKGAAHVVEGLYPPGTRLVGDVDMLIDADAEERAAQALMAIGYEASTERLPERHRHLPVLHDRASGLAIELHTRIEESIDDPVLSLPWFTAQSRPLSFRGAHVRLPDPTRLVGHNFVHHRVNDVSRASPVELRWLLDVALIRARHDDSIDWASLDRFSVGGGRGEVLATYLTFQQSLLGQQPPPLLARPDKDAMRKLREYIDPSLRRPGHGVDIVSYVFSGSQTRHVAGHCWQISLPDEFLPGDVDAGTRHSALELYEGDQQLGPAFSPRKVIERVGKGAYLHWDKRLYFSTPDNSSPRKLKKTYMAKSWISSSSDVLGTIRRLSAEKASAAKSYDAERELFQNHISNLEAQITELRAHAAALQATLVPQIESLHAEIEQMRASIFWRVRMFLQKLRRPRP